jgi:hypothetical protein
MVQIPRLVALDVGLGVVITGLGNQGGGINDQTA